MTTQTTPAEGRLHHELVLHDGTPELIDLMVPFVRDGADADETVVVIGEPDVVGALLEEAGDVPNLRVVREPGRPHHPGRDLRRFREALQELEEAGTGTRVINQMPTMTPDQWQEWRRYEAAVNVVLAPFEVRGACAYDISRVQPGVVDELCTSHPWVRSADGLKRSTAFPDLEDRVRGYLRVAPDPVEDLPPDVAITDPTARAARAAIRELAHGCSLSPTQTELALLAVSETVTNAWRHGRPPVRLRAWALPDRLVVSVTDTGSGPDPLVGLLPVALHLDSGRGMWILHQVLDEIHHRCDGDGYTVRFAVEAS